MPVRSSVLYSVKFMRRANVRKKSRKRERIRPLTSSSLISREEKEVKVVILSSHMIFSQVIFILFFDEGEDLHGCHPSNPFPFPFYNYLVSGKDYQKDDLIITNIIEEEI